MAASEPEIGGLLAGRVEHCLKMSLEPSKIASSCIPGSLTRVNVVLADVASWTVDSVRIVG